MDSVYWFTVKDAMTNMTTTKPKNSRAASELATSIANGLRQPSSRRVALLFSVEDKMTKYIVEYNGEPITHLNCRTLALARATVAKGYTVAT